MDNLIHFHDWKNLADMVSNGIGSSVLYNAMRILFLGHRRTPLPQVNRVYIVCEQEVHPIFMRLKVKSMQ